MRGRGDPLLELAHLGLERGLVADGRGHAAEERRHLGARLHEAEDVVDEEQHVLAALLAEVLGHREAGERDAKARAGRLVHLAEDEHRLVDDARLLHLEPEVVALARALADAAEGREALVLLGDRADQLLDEDGLADAGAAEQADLAALRVRREEVDDLDARLEDLLGGSEVFDRGRRAVDRPALLRLDIARVVDRLAEEVEDPAERVLAHRDRDRPAGVDHVVAALEAVGRVHRDGADAVVAEVLLHLQGQIHCGALVGLLDLDLESGVDLRELAGERDVDDDAEHLVDAADVALRLVRQTRRLELWVVSVSVSDIWFLLNRAPRRPRLLQEFPV